MPPPDFLLCGTAKAGTSFLYLCLREHPGVFVPDVKEPMTFALGGKPAAFTGPGDEGVNGWSVAGMDAYAALFDAAPPGRVTGECSTWYLHDADAPRRIRDRNPDVRVVAVLRDPVERAHSAWLHLLRDGRETERDFAAALDLEPSRIERGFAPIWHYRAMGRYAAQVRRYREVFDDEQLLFLLYDDLRDDPEQVLRALFAFLGVDAGFRPDTGERPNVSEVPRDPRIQEWLDRPSPLRKALGLLLPDTVKQRILESWKRANRHRPALVADVRAALREDYREDILELQDLLGRDLSPWLTSGSGSARAT